MLSNLCLQQKGYQSLENIYTNSEVNIILQHIEKELEPDQQTFAMRAFLQQYPTLLPLIFNKKLKQIIAQIAPKAQIIRSIYFDKPPAANWIVNWHQDLTINVNQKLALEGFKNWRILKNRTVVQPSLEVLENIFTIRIHLDDCTAKNGALRVVPNSHKAGIIPVAAGISDWIKNEETVELKKGGIFLMKPLLLHASRRTENNLNRRVIHIELSLSLIHI